MNADQHPIFACPPSPVGHDLSCLLHYASCIVHGPSSIVRSQPSILNLQPSTDRI
jgi:hypothetical protein